MSEENISDRIAEYVFAVASHEWWGRADQAIRDALERAKRQSA